MDLDFITNTVSPTFSVAAVLWVDNLAAWKYVNFLSIRELFCHYFLNYYRFFMETESVSEVSGSHDMEAIEKKIIISAY